MTRNSASVILHLIAVIHWNSNSLAWVNRFGVLRKKITESMDAGIEDVFIRQKVNVSITMELHRLLCLSFQHGFTTSQDLIFPMLITLSFFTFSPCNMSVIFGLLNINGSCNKTEPYILVSFRLWMRRVVRFSCLGHSLFSHNISNITDSHSLCHP